MNQSVEPQPQQSSHEAESATPKQTVNESAVPAGEAAPGSDDAEIKTAEVQDNHQGSGESPESGQDGKKGPRKANRRQRDSTYGRSRVGWPGPPVMARINTQLEDLLPQLMPSPEALAAGGQQKLQARVEALVRTVAGWEEARVEAFGSSVTLLGLPNSDLDLCVVFPSALRTQLQALYDREPPAPPQRRKRRNESSSSDKDEAEDDQDQEQQQQPRQDDEENADEDTKSENECEDRENMEKDPKQEYFSYKSHVVDRLVQLLEAHGFTDILGLPRARVPIVKFRDPQTGLCCDLGIDNLVAIRNSQLLRDYVRFDPRVRSLAYLVKYWTKQRDINNPYRGTLSSYTYVLLVLFYLMHRPRPVIPCLQALLPGAETPRTALNGQGYQLARLPLPRDAVVLNPEPVEGADCRYLWSLQLQRSWPQLVQKHTKPNPYYRASGGVRAASLGELLVGFMKFWSREFDYVQSCVSVRAGCLLDKAAKKEEWVASVKRDHHCFSIEDPFETGLDLGRVCDSGALFEIRGEFMRADKLLCERGAVSLVFQKFDLDDKWRNRS